MKFRNLPFALCLMLCLAGSFLGQKTAPPKNKRETVRELERANNAKEVRQSYEQNAADGMHVIIYQYLTNEIVAVDPRKAFKSGDRFRLRLQSNFNGYVYVVNVTPGGEKRLLFPRGQSRGNNVRAGQFYYVPAANEFQFNDEPGLEVLQILMSRSRVSFLDAVLDRAPKKASYIALDSTVIKSLESLAGKPARLKSGGITTKAAPGSGSGTKTRMLILDRKKESTFLIVAGDKELPSRFQPGEVSVFEIRLNHH